MPEKIPLSYVVLFLFSFPLCTCSLKVDPVEELHVFKLYSLIKFL